MKRVLIALILMIATSSLAKAQSIGDIARAERKRQTAVTARVMPEPPEKPPVVVDPKVEARTPEVKPEVKQDLKPEEKTDTTLSAAQETELAQLQQEKGVLLTRLGDVIHDRKAVQEIEERLSQIQKRTLELKPAQ